MDAFLPMTDRLVFPTSGLAFACRVAKSRAIAGPVNEQNLAEIQAMFGENSRAISTLTQLLQTPYEGPYGGSAHYAGAS